MNLFFLICFLFTAQTDIKANHVQNNPQKQQNKVLTSSVENQNNTSNKSETDKSKTTSESEKNVSTNLKPNENLKKSSTNKRKKNLDSNVHYLKSSRTKPTFTVKRCKKFCYANKQCNVSIKKSPLFIEKIIVISTNGKNFDFIKNLISLKSGIYVNPDSKLLEIAKLKLMSTGLFEKTEMFFKKAEKRGNVFLYIKVKPKNTIIIDRIFTGSSRIVPFWAGMGVIDKSFLNTGIKLGFAAVSTSKAEIMNGIYQYGLELSALFPDVQNFPLYTGVRFTNSSLFYRLYGEGEDSDPHNFLSLHYKTVSTRLGTYFPLKNFYVRLYANHDFIFASLPTEAVRHYPDGTSKQVNFGLKDGFSVIGVLKASVIYDTRDLPVLPSEGLFFGLSGEVGNIVTGSDYSFGKIDVLIEKYLKIGKQVWSFHFFGGAITGLAPILKKYYIGDLQDLVAPRALGMNLSVAPSPNFLKTNISDFRWGRMAFKTWFRFDYPLFKSNGFIYRGNIFFSSGIIGLANPSQLRYVKGNFREAVPVDLTFDFGLHLDTKIGTFRLSIANLIGRLPLY